MGVGVSEREGREGKEEHVNEGLLLVILQEALCNVPSKGKKSELSLLQSSSGNHKK